MNLRQIEIFRAVMQAGGISAAARVLGVSQPNISRVLHHTEDQLGMKLFERLKGRLLPTAEATILLREVEKAYHGVEIVRDMARDLALGRVGRLRLVCSPSPGLMLVPQAVARFRREHHGVRVSLEILPQAELIEALLTHQADLGVSMFPSQNPDLLIETIRSGRLVCVCPHDHPLARLAAIGPADLMPHALISYDTDTPQGQVVEDCFRAAGLARDIAVTVRFGQTACALAQAGAGVALVDEFSLMGGSFPGLVQRPFKPEHRFTLSLLRSRTRPTPRTAETFAVVLKEK